MLKENDGFRLVYAKSGNSPKNAFLKTKLEVTEFLIENLNNIDLIVINDVIINKNDLVNRNIKLARYLKLNRIYEI